MKEKQVIHIRIKEKLHQELKEEAEQLGISLNAYISLILIDRNSK